MCASTLGVIVTARELLGQRSRLLTVRSPSTYVRRPSGICHLDDIHGPRPEDADALPAKALGSWVAVPSTEQSGPQTDVPAPSRVPALAGRTSALKARAVSVDGLAEIA